MKTASKNTFLRIVLTVLAAVCAFLCFATLLTGGGVTRANADSVEKVHVGDTFEADDYMIGGTTPAEGMKIVYPTGGMYSSDKFTIEQAGKYQVTYYATVNGNRVSETKSYMAIRRPQDMIIADAGTTIEYGKFHVDGPFEIQKETYGAIVYFKAGQTITFATTLKTSQLTKNFNFIDLMAMPSVYGETDFEKMTIRLTDVEDENNYVEIIVNSSNQVDGAGMISYLKAGANGRMYGGYEGNTFHTRNYGTQAEHSFRGWGTCWAGPNDNPEDRSKKTISENSLTLSMDYETKSLYCGPLTPTDLRNRFMNDLDDPDHYKSDPWLGFPSGEVKVSVKADSFSKSQAAVLIKSFGTYKFSKDIEDTQAPEIKIDYDMSSPLPTAQVGMQFPILPFSAKDNLDTTVKTNVWVNLLDSSGKKISVETKDNSFFVKYAGTYEIIYHAEDNSGNVKEERLVIAAKEAIPSIVIGIDQPTMAVPVYSVVDVPYAKDVAISGGSGALTITRAVYDPNEKLVEIKDKLTLTELGNYKVVYTVTDYFGNVATGTKTITSQAIDAPKFVQEPDFIDCLIKGFTYDFAPAIAVETVNGKVVYLNCKTYVNGTEKTGSFKASGTEAVIRYVAEGTTGTITWEDTIPVVDTEEGKYKSDYFYTVDNLAIINQKDNLEFSFSESAKAIFVNPIGTQSFNLMFYYDAAKMNFGEMRITLIDAADANRTATFYLFYDASADSWFLQTNDGAEKVDFAASKGMMSFTYAAGNHKIVDGTGESIATVLKYDNGEDFEGFSNRLYFEISFANVKTASSIYLTQICNQVMGYSMSVLDKATDEIKPIIVLDDVFILRQKIGTKANIPTAMAFDVLGQIREFTVTVEKDGVTLLTAPADQPIDLMLNEAGYYNVSYFAKDTNGNRTTVPYSILVNDETAPELTVNSKLKSQYKVGDKITIPTYSATDNGKNCYIQVTVLLPDNEMRLLHYSENGNVTSFLSKDSNIYDNDFKADLNTFYTQKTGKYVIRIVAYDDYYNYTVKEITFIVK